ncbi:hypothetical protein DCS_02233 [Drechmeria coniospora]|uniref:Retrovirus-related Pol polyprotein from transposon TNT 1-94-like beta-barrel domain-containing protein n=1 Tax=Drechmeria coniospora TaxID=98403 RepID=A0A151GVP2_DRECN|nr:hypothetical protein DCS_02233 [Drechmeria coniospora]KYK61092.1 hypothetical protein DCS_02233 [Drechmeria coniospora]
MSTSSANSKANVVLQTSEDWDRWFGSYQRIAKQNEIWHYVNPDGAVILSPPKETTYKDEVAKINEATLIKLKEEGKEDQFVPIEYLSSRAKERYQLERSEYNSAIRRYCTYREACMELGKWIEETVNPDLLNNLNDIVEVFEIVSKVRERLGIIPHIQENQIRTNNTMRLGIPECYQKREAAYIDAVAFDTPDIQGTFGITQPDTEYTVLDGLPEIQSAFTMMPKAHPLTHSTLFGNCATTHVVNSKDLLEEQVPSEDSDEILVGNTVVQVMCRGKRIMKGLLNGPDGPKTRDLILKDVAFVPGFYTNLISGNKLQSRGVWYCGIDDTLRFGTLQQNQVVLTLSRHYGLVVAEFKTLDSCFKLPYAPLYCSRP